jgi:hypothetical protein
MSREVDAVMASMTGCEIGSACVLNMDMQTFIGGVAAQMRVRGRCAGQHVDGVTDQLSVGVTPTEVDNVQVYGCPGQCSDDVPGDPQDTCRKGCKGGQVRWTPGSIKNTHTWRAKGSPAPTPTPESNLCDPDTPDVGRYQIEFRPRAGGNRFFVTATPKVTGNQPYCSTHNEDPRAQVNCPFWPEGHPKRSDCERKHAFPVWFGAVQREDNPFSADAERFASVTVCHRETCADPGNQATCRMCSGPQVIQ